MDDQYEGQHPVFIDLHHRVGRLENGFGDLKDTQQRNGTELALIQKDVGYIRIAQDKVSLGVNRILWAIAISVIAAVITFITSGGLVLANQ